MFGISAGLFPVVLIGLIILWNSINILPEYERGVVFRLGRVTGARGPGLILVIPGLERMVRVDLRTITHDVPVQEVITKDNVPCKVNAVCYFEVIDPVRADGTTTLRELDVGGGLGIRYRDETPMDVRAFAAAVVPVVKPTGLTMYMEPGRYLVGQAGLLLTRVLFRKHSGGKEFVIVDAGMNDLERPSRYQAYHGIVPVRAREGSGLIADVVGPVCETGDFFALDREIGPVESGDLVAILGAGAYGMAMASNYNTRALPAEVIVDGGKAWLARPRQELDELFESERAGPDA